MLTGVRSGRRGGWVTLASVLALVATTATAYAMAGSRQVLGAPERAWMDADGDVRWILPGRRELDPAIFGTPGNPLGFEADVGVPLDQRMTSEDGTEYTTTAGPTPFSDSWAPIEGDAGVKVVDRTAVAGSETADEIDAEFEFTSPDGEHTYRVVVDQPLPQIPDHENFGGVGLNVVQHGRTGIGTKLEPQAMAYITFWGVAELYRDGELMADDRFVHFMVTERVRDPRGDYSLGFDEDVNHDEVHGHLILPPVAVTPDGPIARPVETGFGLAKGSEQPFIHVMFENITKLKGN